MKAMCLVFVVLGLISVVCGAPVTLPDYTGPTLSLDSGYVTVNTTTGRNVFYILSRVLNPNPSAPLVFWYQGGPGCSGLGGFMQEHGPVVASSKGGGVEYRTINWNSFANVVFLESPAGVGFSFSKLPYTPSDLSTAGDNYQFVLGFLKKYPEFASSKIWLTGESYGGTYVPLLARLLTRPSSPVYSQFAGFAVGNPVFRCDTLDSDSVDVFMLYGHGLTSFSRNQQWVSQCQTIAPSQRPQSCADLLNTIMTEVGGIDQQLLQKKRFPTQPSLDPDDLYQDFCTGNGTLEFITSNPEDCHSIDDLTDAYLSRVDVQQALHVDPSVIGTKWSECNMNVNGQFVANGGDMNLVYADIFRQNPQLAVLVYSGDVDILTVPYGLTMYCLNKLAGDTGQTKQRNWGPWFVNGYTAGYWESFNNFTYATIKGAGHEAMQYQPLSSLNMVQRWISSQSLLDPTSGSGGAAKRRVSQRGFRQSDALRMFQERTQQHQ